MINKGNSKALRKGRASLLNHYYHIRFGTSDKKRIFKELNACRKIIRQLWLSDYFGNTKTITFCIMPDHIHWIIQLNKGDLSQAVGRVKSGFSKESNQKIWQKGFFDHAIRDEGKLTTVARYIVANPIRAGIVKNVRDYPHWDAVWV